MMLAAASPSPNIQRDMGASLPWSTHTGNRPLGISDRRAGGRCQDEVFESKRRGVGGYTWPATDGVERASDAPRSKVLDRSRKRFEIMMPAWIF
jgi:hypothetical protein